MPKPVSSAKKAAAPRPASPWAVALLVLASGFAALAMALLSTGYTPA